MTTSEAKYIFATLDNDTEEEAGRPALEKWKPRRRPKYAKKRAPSGGGISRRSNRRRARF